MLIRLSHFNGKKTVPTTEHRRVALRAHTALAEFLKGAGTREEFADICDSVNVVEALATIGKLDRDEVSPLVTDAITGLVTAAKCPPGMMGFGPAAAFAARRIVCLHDEAIGRFSAATMYEAWQLVLAKIADKSANAENGLLVVDA
jgi:hypothetical protein